MPGRMTLSAKDGSMFDGILQLPHVSRPGIVEETVQTRGVELKVGQSEADRTLAHKMAGQGENVVLSLTQGWHLNLNNAKR